MNRLITFFIVLASVLNANAAIHIVNNSPGQSADFTGVQAAINAAAVGDSIYIQPSLTSYGDVSVNKQVVILGAGHNPEFSNYASTLGIVTFQNGSTGAILKGCSVWIVNTSGNHTANNIVISGCKIDAQGPFGIAGGTFANWLIEGNIISSQSNGINVAEFDAGTVFRNNILFTYAGSNIVSYGSSATLFENNLMMCVSNPSFSSAFANSNNVIARNNVIYVTPASGTNAATGCNNCTWENNATYNPNVTLDALPGAGNLDNTNPDFINVPLLNPSFNYLNNYQLNVNSPLLTAATDGGEIGIYGGVFEFRMGGEDNTLPRIKSVTPLTATAPPGGVLQINLKAAAAGN
jgi:hypothetical protein